MPDRCRRRIRPQDRAKEERHCADHVDEGQPLNERQAAVANNRGDDAEIILQNSADMCLAWDCAKSRLGMSSADRADDEPGEDQEYPQPDDVDHGTEDERQVP